MDATTTRSSATSAETSAAGSSESALRGPVLLATDAQGAPGTPLAVACALADRLMQLRWHSCFQATPPP
jgi:hypothetical protein